VTNLNNTETDVQSTTKLNQPQSSTEEKEPLDDSIVRSTPDQISAPKRHGLLPHLWWMALVFGLIYLVILSQDDLPSSASMKQPTGTATHALTFASSVPQANLFSPPKSNLNSPKKEIATLRLPTDSLTVTPTPEPVYVTYTIDEGDLLGAIAAQYDLEVEAIMEANNITDPTLLQIGQVLRIPMTVTPLPSPSPQPKESPLPSATPQIHVIKKGDSPLSVALQYNTSVESIMRVNGIFDPSSLQIGQELIIPAEDDLANIALNQQTLRYKVRSGETLLSMASVYGSSVDEILQANPGLKPTNLQIGQELMIPLTRPPANTPNSVASSPPVVVIPAPSSTGLVGLQQQMIAAVNAYRQANGLSAYQADEQLNQIALARAQDMDSRGYFSHWTPEGKRAADLVREQGISGGQVSENIQRNTQSETETVTYAIHWFMNDATHRTNILHSSYNRLGVGVSETAGLHTFVLIFVGN